MIKIFLDGATTEVVTDVEVDGYTTNPTLMKASGVTNYLEFANEFLKVANGLPVSFEVINKSRIVEETRMLSNLGSNVFVKIPVDGNKNIKLIQDLNMQGYKINATAVFMVDQVMDLVKYLRGDTELIISIFAGRIADTGVDPCYIIRDAVKIVKTFKNVSILWASTREVINIYQAEECGCHIITVTPDILKKYKLLKNKGLFSYSIETAEQFYNDGKELTLHGSN